MRQKKQPRRSRLMRSNNVLVFKLIDPICQSLLFILFVYVIDVDNGFSDSGITYRSVLELIIGLQVLSAIINFFINEPKQLKTERVMYLVTISLYLLFYYINRNGNEKYLEVIGGGGPVKMPVHEILLMTAGLLITFWYFVICFREIRSLLRKANNDS